jgi:hypothetical protein
MAECYVKQVKNIYRKSEDKEMGLMIYRSTPLADGKSPAELLFKRKIRTNLPMLHLQSKNKDEIMSQVQSKRKQKQAYDRKGVKELTSLRPNQSVRVKVNDGKGAKWQMRARVVKEVAPRSYLVKCENGAELRRNRKDLLATREPPPEMYDRLEDLIDHMTSPPSNTAEQDSVSPLTNSSPPQVPRTAGKDVDKPMSTPIQERPKRVIKKTQRFIEIY